MYKVHEGYMQHFDVIWSNKTWYFLAVIRNCHGSLTSCY